MLTLKQKSISLCNDSDLTPPPVGFLENNLKPKTNQMQTFHDDSVPSRRLSGVPLDLGER